MIRLVSAQALVLLVLTLVGCKPATPPAPATPPTPVPVKAGDLLKEYGGNALAADSKYKGKLLNVTGKFGSAQKAPLLGYAVQLEPQDAGDVNLSYVQCFILESAEPEVAKMQAGQIVTLQGYCDGQVVGQVKVTKCIVVK